MRDASLLSLATLALAVGCDLQRDIDVAFPNYDAPPVLECYLTPGEPFRLLLTRSEPIAAPIPTEAGDLLTELLLDSAVVTIAYRDTAVLLENVFTLDPAFRQGFNYVSEVLVPREFRDSFRLTVDLPGGGTIRAATRLLPAIPNDSTVVEFDAERLKRGDSLARVRTFFSDPEPERVNRFHHVLLEADLKRASEQDAVFTDEFHAGGALGTVSLYRFAPGTPLLVVTAHVDAVFERYERSNKLARASNGNPYAQPSPLIGNLHGEGAGAGALGIFTAYGRYVEEVEVPR